MKRNANRLQPPRLHLGAFTIIELITVVAVLVILAALAVTAVSRARVKARDMQCLARLRQNGIAMANFLAQNSTYPLAMNLDPANPNHEHSRSFYASLSKSGLGPLRIGSEWNPIYRCPSGVLMDGGMSGRSAMFAYNAFGMEGRIFPSTGLGGRLDEKSERVHPVSEADVVNPAEMIAMGDPIMGWNASYKDSVWAFSRTRYAEGSDEATARVRRLHSENGNVVFCDGHTTALPLSLLFASREPSALRIWNADNQPHSERLKDAITK